MTQCPDLAEQWTERRHAAEAFLREFLDEQYPISPDESDPWRRRVEASLARRAEPPWPLSAQEAADYLEARFLVRFPDALDLPRPWQEAFDVAEQAWRQGTQD
jgi:hypothetical protein